MHEKKRTNTQKLKKRTISHQLHLIMTYLIYFPNNQRKYNGTATTTTTT